MSQASLVPTFAGLGALLCAVWWFADRAPAGDRSVVARAPESAREQPAEVLRAGTLDAPHGSRRTPIESEASTSAAVESLAPATISGRLQVDGLAPYHGEVRIEAENGPWQHTATIDPYGRFYIEGVPPSRLTLSFEMEWLAERQLLLPAAVTTPVPGKTEVVDLDWRTRHVDVRVVNGDEAPGQASVDIHGPHYQASFDTNEQGKAKLSLVGNGSFSFRAALPSGRRGEASVELHEGDELETVVIIASQR